MSLAYVGSLSIAALCVSSFSLFAQLSGENQAQLTGLIAAQVDVSVTPPTYAATIEVLLSAVATLQAAIAAGITAPQISAGAGLSAQIEILTALAATFSAMLEIGEAGGAGGAAGIDVFSWSGVVSAFGPALSAQLAAGAPSGGSSNDASNALVLLTRSSATWSAMSSFFGGA